MDITKIFRKFIILSAILLLLTIIFASFYPTSEDVNQFNDKHYMQWANENLFFVFLIFPLLILHLVSFYMLYKFKKNGKRIFEITVIIFFIYDLFSGSYAYSGLEMVITGLYFIIYGVILAILYLTPISKKF